MELLIIFFVRKQIINKKICIANTLNEIKKQKKISFNFLYIVIRQTIILHRKFDN